MYAPAVYSRFACESTQPFGGPVVPDVYTIVAVSSGATAAVRSRATVSPVSAPRLRRSASVIAPSASPDSTTTCSSSGSCSRTDAIFAACAASSSSTTFAPLWESTYSHSSDEFVWYTGTTTRAGAERAEVGHRPLGNGAAQDRDGVPGLHAE